MSAVARLPVPNSKGGEEVELTCSNGHRTTHSLARVLRLNDSWCGRCGVGICYPPEAGAGAAKAGKGIGALRDSGVVLSRSTG